MTDLGCGKSVAEKTYIHVQKKRTSLQAENVLDLLAQTIHNGRPRDLVLRCFRRDLKNPQLILELFQTRLNLLDTLGVALVPDTFKMRLEQFH